MRILHITPTYIPAYRYGGPIHSVHALCRSLAQEAGHDVHVLTTSVDGPIDSDVPYDRPVTIDNVLVHYCRANVLRRLYWSSELASQCLRMVDGFDAVHLHSVFLFPTWAGARAARHKNIPYVLSPRGMLVDELIKSRSALIKRAWIRFIERGNLAGAARIHLTSEEELQSLSGLDLCLAPVSVIPNGVDVPTSFTPESISSDVRHILAEGFDVLSFGRISWKKGLDRLVQSLAAAPSVKALIAGNDEENLASELKAVAASWGVADRVTILPRQIMGADKEALFAAARVFALPSLSENFGNVIAEAMIRGVPVVVTANVGVSKLVQASGAGAIASSDPARFGGLIADLLMSKERLKAMGAAGADFARKELNWSSIAGRFGEVYKEIATYREQSEPRGG